MVIYKHTAIQSFNIINKLFIFRINPTGNGISKLIHQKLGTVFIDKPIFQYFQLKNTNNTNNVWNVNSNGNYNNWNANNSLGVRPALME